MPFFQDENIGKNSKKKQPKMIKNEVKKSKF